MCCKGLQYIPNWARDRFCTRKVLHDMLTKMGGNQFVHHRFRAPVAAEAQPRRCGSSDQVEKRCFLSADEIKAAIKVIRENAPKSNKMSMQTEFIIPSR